MSISLNSLQCDLLVAGGGPAGVPCALAAARRGAKVILVQDRPVLGGNASSEIRMHIVGANCHGQRGTELEVEAREGGIIEEIRLETAVQNPQRCANILDLVLFNLCRREPNLTLLLNTTVVGATTNAQGAIESVRAVRESTEEHFEIAATLFVDCTGDGRLGVEAGAEYRRGREAKSEFGESLAQEKADRYSLGSSLLFTARKHDRPMPFIAPPWVRKITASDLKLRPAHGFSPEGEPTYEYGHWWLEWGGHLDTIKENEAIRDELLAILFGVWDHVKNSGEHPQSANWAMDWFSTIPGKRESRRFIGQYTLTQNDVEQSRAFDDAIAFGGWFIDTHPPEGFDAPTQEPCTQHWVEHLYDIPLRCCISRNVPNLMFAGRNLSATHIAFASTRVMATCAAVGQAVGVAAAYALENGIAANALAASPEAMETIQQRLLRDDLYLIGRTNCDPADLARRATVSASSEKPGAEARLVLSGQTRAVHGQGGAPFDRAAPGLHRWMSAPLKASGGYDADTPWIELAWPEPIQPSEIVLVFDTGLHRELILSPSDACQQKSIWGPQPETVKDYRIRVRDAEGAWRTAHEITGNYQRQCSHLLEAAGGVTALRVEVAATHGVPEARLCEIRVY